MKKLVLVLCLAILSNYLCSQNFQLFYDDYGNPRGIKAFDSTGVHIIQIDKAPENGVVKFELNGIHHAINLKEESRQNTRPNNWDIDNYEPGILPEGDLVIDLEYSLDGSLLAAVFQHNNEVCFYDSETYEVVAVVETGRAPFDLEFIDSLAYVCCRDSREVYKISMNDFSILDVFSFRTENASKIDLNHDGSVFYVSFYSWVDGSVEGYDAQTGEQLFNTHRPYIHQWSILGIQGRSSYWFRHITCSPSDNFFIGMISPTGVPAIFDGQTGEIIKQYENENLRGLEFSQDGDTIFLLSTQKDSDWMILRRILYDGFIVLDSIKSYTPDWAIDGLAANSNSTKFLSSNDWLKLFFLFDFNSDTCLFIESPLSIASPVIHTSADRKVAFTRLIYYYYFFDFDSGEFVGQTYYDHHLHDVIAVHPTEDKFAVTRWLGYGYYDKLYTFDFSDPENSFVDTLLVAGELPEADVVTSAVLSNNGSQLYATNSFSSNLSIIDYETGVVDTIMFFQGIKDVTTIPNSDLILLYGHTASKLTLFDPLKKKVVKAFPLVRITSVFVSDDGQFAYANYSAAWHSTLYKIALDGENSEIAEELYFRAKTCSLTYLFSEMDRFSSKPGLSPDSKYFLSGTESEEGDEAILVIDTDLMEIVATLPIYDGCIWEWVFTPDSKRVCALTSGNLVKPIIYLDGENSYIENEVGDVLRSFSAVYNPKDEYFYILGTKIRYIKVDPLTGDVVETIATEEYEMYLQIGLDQNNEPVIRKPYSLLYDREFYDLPGPSKDFSYHAGNNLFIIPIPGPDIVSVFDPLTVSIENYPKKQVEDKIHISPNPANDQLIVSSERAFQKIEIIDLQGRLVYSGNFNNRKTTIPLGKLERGIFVVKVTSHDKVDTRKLIVSR